MRTSLKLLSRRRHQDDEQRRWNTFRLVQKAVVIILSSKALAQDFTENRTPYASLRKSMSREQYEMIRNQLYFPKTSRNRRITYTDANTDNITRLSGWMELTANDAPPSRKMHSASVLTLPFWYSNGSAIMEPRQYMIITGGFTHEDVTSFPVYAFDMTSTHNITDSTPSEGQWYSLGSANQNQNNTLWPTGMAGHISAISSSGDLYVFGGITYREGKPYTEESDVWKAALTPATFSTYSLTWEKIIINSTKNFIPRGEAAGGFWKASADSDEYLIIYGGLAISYYESLKNNDTIASENTLDDLWAFHLKSGVLENWYSSSDATPFSTYFMNYFSRNAPSGRTAHAATITSDKLFVHGGVTELLIPQYSSMAQQIWQVLSDAWEFDLSTKTWRESLVVPNIARLYHSVVSKNQTLIVSGGFYESEQRSNFSVADVLLLFPNNQFWYNCVAEEDSASTTKLTPRYQHTANVDNYGSLFVWGGRNESGMFPSSSVWRLDILDSNGAPVMDCKRAILTDGTTNNIADVHKSIYSFVAAVVIVGCVMFAAPFACKVCLQEVENHVDQRSNRISVVSDVGAPRADSRATNNINTPRGVRREIIDALPIILYRPHNNGTIPDQEHQQTYRDCDETNEVQFCAICLANYENDVEIRELPCCHRFHKDCIDVWLSKNNSCPACRSSVEERGVNRDADNENLEATI